MTQVLPSKDGPSSWVLLFSDVLISLFDRCWQIQRVALQPDTGVGARRDGSLLHPRSPEMPGASHIHGSCHSPSQQGSKHCGTGRDSLRASRPSSCLKAESGLSTYLSLSEAVLKDTVSQLVSPSLASLSLPLKVPSSLPSFSFGGGMSLLQCLCRLTNFNASSLICCFYSFSHCLCIFLGTVPSLTPFSL